MAEYRICARCVMDTSDPEIHFDASGVCNHCRDYDLYVRHHWLPADQAEERLTAQFAEVRRDGRGRPYDCILGVSGGCDSSYTAYLAGKNSLRTLLVHMDNSWDSELSVQNIQKIVRRTEFDYENIVIDWEEFRDLQRAYILAGVIDIEVVTDHALRAVAYQVAARHGVRWILRGSNLTLEKTMPKSWGYEKNDLANLLAIHQRYGSRPLKTYPMLGRYRLLRYCIINGIRELMPLSFGRFDLSAARDLLRREFGWQDPGQKHFESVFTRFYQGYILPRKFGVDKRRAHLTDQILSGQITREEALERLKQEVYDREEMESDYQFVLKKLGFTADEFERIMSTPPVPHSAFPTDRLTPWQWLFLTAWQIPRRIRVAVGGRLASRSSR